MCCYYFLTVIIVVEVEVRQGMGRRGNEPWRLRWNQRPLWCGPFLLKCPRPHYFRKGVDSTQSSRRSEEDGSVSLCSGENAQQPVWCVMYGI